MTRRWVNRMERLKDRQRGIAFQKKTPANWPFCLGCHLAAPEAKYPMDARDARKGRAPDLSTWGAVETPNEHLFREKHHICPTCTIAVARALTRRFQNVSKKLKDIAHQEAVKAGLIPRLQKSIALVKREQLVHDSDCGVHEAGEDLPSTCTCGFYMVAR